jgi:hypothetical protein
VANYTSKFSSTTYKSLIRGVLPVGSIIGLHPEVEDEKVNTIYYKKCVGGGTIDLDFGDGDITTIDTPNLNDGRFLSGGFSSGVGGSNSITLELENIPSHLHAQSHNHMNIDPKKSKYIISNFITDTYDPVSYTSSHTHSYTHVSNTEAKLNLGGTVPAFAVIMANQTSDTSKSAINFYHEHNPVSTTVASVPAVLASVGSSTPFDNRPKYFGVKFFIRVK